MSKAKSQIWTSIIIIGASGSARIKSAKKLTALINPFDQIVVAPQPSIGIDQIRQVVSFVSLTPVGKSGKVVIFNEAQMMTLEAQNAILKTLEEPPGRSCLILTAPTTDLLLPTIISRCQIINLGPLSSPINHRQITALKEALRNGIPACLTLAENLARSRDEALGWLSQAELVWRDCLLLQPDSDRSAWLIQAIRLADKARRYLQANTNIRLTLELFLIDLLDLRYNEPVSKPI